MAGGFGGLGGLAFEFGFEFGAEGFGVAHFLLGGEPGLGFGVLPGLPVGFELAAGFGVFGGA